MDNAFCFYSIREVEKMTTLSRTTLWRRVKEKAFPQPVQLSPGRKAWKRVEVENWIKQMTLKRPDAGSLQDPNDRP